MDRVSEAMKDVESMELEFDVPMAISLRMQGMSMDVTIHMSFVEEFTMEPKAMHMKGSMSMSFLGRDSENSVETYQFYEGNTLTKYTWDEAESVFVRTVEESADDPTESPVESFTEGEIDWTVEEKDDVYILSTELTKEQMMDVFDNIGEGSGSSLPIDAVDSADPITVQLTIDKQTMRVTEITMDMSSIFAAAFKASVEESMEGAEVSADAPVTFRIRRYNEIGTITPPENYVDGSASNS